MRVEEIKLNPDGQTMVATFDERELVVVLFEAMMGLKRPDGVSAADAYAEIERREPRLHEVLRRCSVKAMEYVVDRMNNAETMALQ